MPETDLNVFIHDYKKSHRNSGAQPVVNRQYLTVSEYAEKTRRSPVTVRQMCANGKIDGAVKDGKSWLIPMSEPSDMTALREENIRLIKENTRLTGLLNSIVAMATAK